MDTEKYKGYTITIDYDEDCGLDSPASWGNFDIVENSEDFYTESGKLLPSVQAKMRAGKMFLVDKLEHGNVIYRLASGIRDWDTSTNWGWIVFTDEYATNFSDYEGRRNMAKSDLETYTQWANGEVYGYTIVNQYGEEVEDGSCWGIYGSEYALEEAKMAVDSDIKYDRPAMHAKNARELHR